MIVSSFNDSYHSLKFILNGYFFAQLCSYQITILNHLA